jgi:L-lactate dehydrogenase complex protein LldG
MAIDDNQLSREAVLARVRQALGRDGPDDDARTAAHAYLAARAQGPRPGMPADLVQRFIERAGDMSSTGERVAGQDAVPPAVARYLAGVDSADWPGVCWPELATLGWSDAGVRVESRPTVGHDAVGITGCFCAIAETGTLVFLTGTQTPSATFLLPETHVAIVRADQIVSAMEDAFARIRSERGELPRAVNLVSGPSRTGDIEQTIVLGAHGPRRLHIVLVG